MKNKIIKLISLPFIAIPKVYRAIKKAIKKSLRVIRDYYAELRRHPHKFYILLIINIFIFGTSFLMWRDCLAYESNLRSGIGNIYTRVEIPQDKSERVQEENKDTPEQQYLTAYREDTGFREYIDNAKVNSNNFGNLVFANQPNATKDGRFASFKTPYDGFRALIKQLEADMARGDSLEKFIYEYAPPEENDTAKYLNFLEEACGSRYLSLHDVDILLLAVKITEFEHSYKFN